MSEDTNSRWNVNTNDEFLFFFTTPVKANDRHLSLRLMTWGKML